jgi:hypothetical protein
MGLKAPGGANGPAWVPGPGRGRWAGRCGEGPAGTALYWAAGGRGAGRLRALGDVTAVGAFRGQELGGGLRARKGTAAEHATGRGPAGRAAPTEPVVHQSGEARGDDGLDLGNGEERRRAAARKEQGEDSAFHDSSVQRAWRRAARGESFICSYQTVSSEPSASSTVLG